MLMIAVKPSRTSSPEKFASFSPSRPIFRPYLLIVLVSAERNPVRWVPPSAVLMLLAKVEIRSV